MANKKFQCRFCQKPTDIEDIIYKHKIDSYKQVYVCRLCAKIMAKTIIAYRKELKNG